MDRKLKGSGLAGSTALLSLLMCICINAHAQIYKIVDKDGNVTYTDQAPADGSEPMDLPELSVVTTDYEEAPPPSTELEPDRAEEPLTPADLRKLYRDFRITRPTPEETFWGTENSVVVTWDVSEPLQAGMSVRFMVDGAAQTSSTENMLGLTLDRGAHTVSAVLMTEDGRSVVTTDTVTFYIQQQSVRSNGP